MIGIEQRGSREVGFTKLRLALALGLLVSTAASAAPILTGAIDNTGWNYNSGYTFGYRFISNVDQNVTALGFWFPLEFPTDRSFQVALWDIASKNLLASASVSNASPADTSITVGGAVDPIFGVINPGQWHYETLGSPVALTNGHDYMLGFYSGATDMNSVDSLVAWPDTLTFAPGVTVPTTYWTTTFGSSITFPDLLVDTNPNFFTGQVNAQLAPLDAVPEPRTFVVVAAGLVLAAWRRRRQSA